MGTIMGTKRQKSAQRHTNRATLTEWKDSQSAHAASKAKSQPNRSRNILACRRRWRD
jgi:hypothetical protein